MKCINTWEECEPPIKAEILSHEPRIVVVDEIDRYDDLMPEEDKNGN